MPTEGLCENRESVECFFAIWSNSAPLSPLEILNTSLLSYTFLVWMRVAFQNSRCHFWQQKWDRFISGKEQLKGVYLYSV